jgi:pimeloyl-ACP methyl ester carboxylesterase
MNTPTLLLLHGLGATNGVWADVLDELDWPGRVINADLPGHGLAPAQDDYTMGALAASVAGSCDNDEEVIAVGHSLGGVVALCLASGFFRPVVKAAIGVGMKLRWTDDDVAMMGRVAAKGVRWFDTRDEAVDRFLRQAGLNGIADRDHPAVETGVTVVDGRWRVTQDPNTFAQRPVDISGLMAAAKCPVLLGAGENDKMVNRDDLAAHVANPRIAAGRGHNVQVEDPAWFASLIMEAADQ